MTTLLNGCSRAGILFLLAVATAATAHAQIFSTLVHFKGTNGAGPFGTLIQGTDGNFYGTTDGTVFKMTPEGTLTTLYTFCSQPDCTDGTILYDGLVQGADGNFYGTTTYGGANLGSEGIGGGTVFKITPDGALSTLYSFCAQPNCTDGENPEAGLVQGTDGNFYGTTPLGGGTEDEGTIFRITPAGVLTTLYSFSGRLDPNRLVQGADGNFYGTTGAGYGIDAYGSVFKMTPEGALTTLYSFCAQAGCKDGEGPGAGLVQGTDGNFYGTTSGGGAYGEYTGTVFKITSEGALTTLYNFCAVSTCPDGMNPEGALVLGKDGNLYGTTLWGGAHQEGTIFSLPPAGTLTTLYSFCSEPSCTDGEYPWSGLVQGTDKNFYGTTIGKGGFNDGTVYSLALVSAAFANVSPPA